MKHLRECFILEVDFYSETQAYEVPEKVKKTSPDEFKGAVARQSFGQFGHSWFFETEGEAKKAEDFLKKEFQEEVRIVRILPPHT
jgi:hypothetical protein